eukprot:6205071-Pleurochrysis_carterae.AAC.4
MAHTRRTTQPGQLFRRASPSGVPAPAARLQVRRKRRRDEPHCPRVRQKLLHKRLRRRQERSAAAPSRHACDCRRRVAYAPRASSFDDVAGSHAPTRSRAAHSMVSGVRSKEACGARFNARCIAAQGL